MCVCVCLNILFLLFSSRYVLTSGDPVDDVASLNGVPLMVAKGGAMPTLTGKSVVGATVVLPPRAVAFVVATISRASLASWM